MNLHFYPNEDLIEVVTPEIVKNFNADCQVRNELNGRRHLHDPKQIFVWIKV